MFVAASPHVSIACISHSLCLSLYYAYRYLDYFVAVCILPLFFFLCRKLSMAVCVSRLCRWLYHCTVTISFFCLSLLSLLLTACFRQGCYCVVAELSGGWWGPYRRNCFGCPWQETVDRSGVFGVHHGQHHQNRRARVRVREKEEEKDKNSEKNRHTRREREKRKRRNNIRSIHFISV